MENLLTIDEVAEFFKVSTSTVREYEERGIIRRVKNIPSIRYHPRMIAEAVGIDMETFSPFVMKRLERENAQLKAELALKNNQLETIKRVLMNVGAD